MQVSKIEIILCHNLGDQDAFSLHQEMFVLYR